METRETRWISVAEVAHHLGVGRDTVYRWIDSKGMPAHRVGRFWKFQLSEVDEWVKSGEADVTNGTGPEDSAGDDTRKGR